MCQPVETRGGVLADVDEHLDILLEDGARLRLFGLESPEPGEAGAAAVALRAALTDRELSVDILSTGLDRWGRRAARVVAGPMPGEDALSAAESLISSGLARVGVEPGPTSCLSLLFSLEAQARGQRRGLWANPANAPLRAGDRAAFAGRDGQYMIVEGRVLSVGETAARLYFNYGPIRTVDFSATAAKATLKTLAASGIDPHALIGALTRVRGRLDTRFGPQIEIVYPSALEIVAPGGVSPYNRLSNPK